MARLRRRLIHNDKQRIPVLVRGLLLLCFVSIMGALVVSNLNTQQEHQLRNLIGLDEEHTWKALPALKECLPVRHIVFLKTHKCASSTIQNILLRHALDQNLSVAVPPTGVYLDDQSLRLNVEDLQESPFAPPSGRYHFLAHHTRLNVRAIKQVTYHGSIWISIVREPAAVFESMFHYYRLDQFYHETLDNLLWKLDGHPSNLGGHPLGRHKLRHINGRGWSLYEMHASYSGWVNKLLGYELPPEVRLAESMAKYRYGGRIGRNQMSWDLGLDNEDLKDNSVLNQALQLLDRTFHLVMVSEHMDESLVLLKHLLCWNDEDIIGLAKNIRKDHYRTRLSHRNVETLHKLNQGDLLIYNHFKEKFFKQVENFGLAKMEQEVKKLRDIRDHVSNECGVTESPQSAQGSDENQFVMQYSVNPQPNTNKSLFFCKRLISTGPELNFILKKKQFARYYPHKLPENRNPIFVNNTKMSRKKPIKVQDNNKKLKKKRKKSPIVAPPKIKIREKLKNLM